jgi:hypothetical protein
MRRVSAGFEGASREGRDNREALYDQVSQGAQSVAILMQAIHGGRWNVQIDHDVGLVAVLRDF